MALILSKWTVRFFTQALYSGQMLTKCKLDNRPMLCHFIKLWLQLCRQEEFSNICSQSQLSHARCFKCLSSVLQGVWNPSNYQCLYKKTWKLVLKNVIIMWEIWEHLLGHLPKICFFFFEDAYFFKHLLFPVLLYLSVWQGALWHNFELQTGYLV